MSNQMTIWCQYNDILKTIWCQYNDNLMNVINNDKLMHIIKHATINALLITSWWQYNEPNQTWQSNDILITNYGK